MRHAIAAWLNERGHNSKGRGSRRRAGFFYRMAARMDGKWSVPHYNLGLEAKYAGQRKQSLAYNQKAVSLNPKDEDAWWNLGIAATALCDWREARRAWRGFGIELANGAGEDEELIMKCGRACVRLNPNNGGEVVWGSRLDPARMVIMNVPLPESNHRFHDVVLNDGAQSGTRSAKGREYPVFDELEIWKPSDYSTFQASLRIPNADAAKALDALCDERELGIDDWSSIRILCGECSRGNPGPHKHKPADADEGKSVFGFGAHNKEELIDLLQTWAVQFTEADYGDVELLLEAGGK